MNRLYSWVIVLNILQSINQKLRLFRTNFLCGPIWTGVLVRGVWALRGFEAISCGQLRAIG